MEHTSSGSEAASNGEPSSSGNPSPAASGVDDAVHDARTVIDTTGTYIDPSVTAANAGLQPLAPRPTGLAPIGTPSAVGTTAGNMPAVAPATPIQVVLDPRMLQPVAVPRSMQWSFAQLRQVATTMALVALAGLVAGWFFGSTREPAYAARSEFIYFLEDANPDGFLREDRRILTQLVTIESETTLRPLAEEFATTVTDLRGQLSVEVIDLSEVVRLDVVDGDPDRALLINQAILDRYREIADVSSKRDDESPLVTRREAILSELMLADQEAATIAEAQLSDVTLQLQEESLRRELDAAVIRSDRLSGIADGLLTETSTFDDRASLEAQIAASRQRLVQLESELLLIRTERGELQRAITRQLAGETPFSAIPNQQRDVTLSVREDSVQLEIDTVAQRIQSLESVLAESLLNTPVTPSGEPVEEQLATSKGLVKDLEEQLVVVSTRRAELAQSAATRPSLTRRIARLEQDLERLDTQLSSSSISAERPSPIEILTQPIVLTETVGNPKVKWAALGLIASLPFAAAAAAMARRRQRKQM